jgi:hypothetical protein
VAALQSYDFTLVGNQDKRGLPPAPLQATNRSETGIGQLAKRKMNG